MDKICTALVLACAACDSTPRNSPDTYYGTVDPTVFASGFLPATDKTHCPNGPCYPFQAGYQGGQQVGFYNFGSVTTKSLPTDPSGNTQIPTSLATAAYNFSNDCVPGTYDPFRNAFDPSKQYPIFSKLPLATTNTKVLVTPMMAVFGVAGLSGEPCNALKTSDSIGPVSGPPGKYGAEAATMPEYRIWAAIDMTAHVNPLIPGSKFGPEYAWYRGLLLQFLDGGKIPTDASGQNLLYMDGVLTNPGNGYFAKPTDADVVILPFKPGDPGYSPIVRLHDYDLAANGKQVGDLTGICMAPPCNDPTQVDISKIPASFNTIFIIWSTQ